MLVGGDGVSPSSLRLESQRGEGAPSPSPGNHGQPRETSCFRAAPPYLHHGVVGGDEGGEQVQVAGCEDQGEKDLALPRDTCVGAEAGRQVRGKQIQVQVLPRVFFANSHVLTGPASPPRKNPFPSLPARPAVGLCAVPPAAPGDCCGMGAAESLRLPTPNQICLREATSPHPLPEQPQEPARFLAGPPASSSFSPGGDCFWCHHHFSFSTSLHRPQPSTCVVSACRATSHPSSTSCSLLAGKPPRAGLVEAPASCSKAPRPRLGKKPTQGYQQGVGEAAGRQPKGGAGGG